MNLKGKRILLTGAAGDLGRELSQALAAKGARLGLVGRTDASVASLDYLIHAQAMDAIVVQADVTDSTARHMAVHRMMLAYGGVDVLVNLAGVLDVHLFSESDAAVISHLLRVNVEAPMEMVREVLPSMIARESGHIVNIGSMFGSIGYPGFAAYSASKFALRGFSQALRRELSHSGIAVTYVAHRGVQTLPSPPAVQAKVATAAMQMDDAPRVAAHIVRAIELQKGESYLGFPESILARINAVMPSLLDRALRKLPRARTRVARGLP
jgi:short-subunit dehydrogenase